MQDLRLAHPWIALGVTLFGEARGQRVRSRVAIGQVVLERLRRPKRFGVDVPGVCLKRLQFSCWWPEGGVSNYNSTMLAAKLALQSNSVNSWVGPDGLNLGTALALQECLSIAKILCTEPDVFVAQAPFATHYHAKSMKTFPKWASDPTAVLVADMDGHLFYRGVR